MGSDHLLIPRLGDGSTPDESLHNHDRFDQEKDNVKAIGAQVSWH
jgi:hypothetical protein